MKTKATFEEVYFLTHNNRSLKISISEKSNQVLFAAAAYGQTPLDFAKFDLECFLDDGQSHLFTEEDCQKIIDFVDGNLNKYERIYVL